MKKKILSLALALVMCLSLSVPALAANESKEEPMFSLVNNSVTAGDFKDGWTYWKETSFTINGGTGDNLVKGYHAFHRNDSWTVTHGGGDYILNVSLLRYKADEKNSNHYYGPGTIYTWRDTGAFVDQSMEENDRNGHNLDIKSGESITFSINKDFNEKVFQGEDQGNGKFAYRLIIYVLYNDRRVNPVYDSPWWPTFYEFKLDEKNALPDGRGISSTTDQTQKEPTKEELKAVYSLKRIEGGKEFSNDTFYIEKNLPYVSPKGSEQKGNHYYALTKNGSFRLKNTGGKDWKLHVTLYPCKLNAVKDGFYSIIPGDSYYVLCQGGHFALDSLTGDDKTNHILWLESGKSLDFSLKDFMENVTSDSGDGTYIYFLYIHARNAKHDSNKCYETASGTLMLDEASAAKVLAQQPSSISFTDVSAGSPFTEAIQWAVNQGITKGTTPTTFGSSNTCTVSHILTFLWRGNGRPGAGDNERAAVAAWAQGLGIDTGDLSAPCTRAMAVTYMWKAAGSPEIDTEKVFSDVSAGAEYAPAVAWAVENGVTSGTTESTFSPDSTCTRGQIVTFLYRASK